MEERPLEEKMFMKETIRKFDFFHILTDILSLKPSQFPVQSIYYNYGFFPEVITFLCTSIHHFLLSSIIYHIH